MCELSTANKLFISYVKNRNDLYDNCLYAIENLWV